MAQPYAYELRIPDVTNLDADRWQDVERSLNSLLRVPHFRLLSYVDRLDPNEFESIRRREMAEMTTDAGRLFVEQEARILRVELTRNPAWSMRHYLTSFGKPLATSQAKWLEEAIPPDVITGQYTEQGSDGSYLVPSDPQHPYLAVLASFSLRPFVTWTWSQPWAEMITGADGPMVICVDAVQLPEEKIRTQREGLNQIQKKVPDLDTAENVKEANRALASREDFYNIRIVVLLVDASLPRLKKRIRRLQQSHEATVGFSNLVGQQIEGLDFFSTLERPRLGAQNLMAKHSFVLGSALPIVVGGLAGISNRVESRGVYIGFRHGMLRDQSLGPVYWLPWDERNRGAHIGIVGQIGGGKTVAKDALLARLRMQFHVPIVSVDPMDNIRKLANLLSDDPGMRLHVFEFETLQLNPLDWIAESLEVEAGLPEQFQHVKANLELMLNRSLSSDQDANIQQGFLARALSVVYQGLTPTDLENSTRSPRLELLCDALSSLRNDRFGDHAEMLAAEIDGLVVRGPMGRIYNRPTSLPLTFNGADLCDLSKVAGNDTGNRQFQTTLYYSIFSQFMRVARRDKRAGKVVRRAVAFDEWFQMALNPFLRERVKLMVRTFRNLYTSIIVAEQNLSTFSNDTERTMLGNIPWWLLFKQELVEAQLAPDLFARFPKHAAQMMPGLPQGFCVGLLEPTMLLEFKLLPSEMDALVRNTRSAVTAPAIPATPTIPATPAASTATAVTAPAIHGQAATAPAATAPA